MHGLACYRHGVVPSHNKSVKVHLYMDGFHFTGFIKHALHTFRHIYLLAAVKGHTKSAIEPATSANGMIMLHPQGVVGCGRYSANSTLLSAAICRVSGLH